MTGVVAVAAARTVAWSGAVVVIVTHEDTIVVRIEVTTVAAAVVGVVAVVTVVELGRTVVGSLVAQQHFASSCPSEACHAAV